MRASTITKSLTAGSANAIALSQTPLAAGNLTINGALASGGVATLSTQRRVIVHSAADDTGRTWTVTGTAEGGLPIKDSFAGANTADAQSNLDFLTVTQISVDAATAGAVTAGTNGVGSSPWKMFSDTIQTPNIAFDFELLSGAANVSIQYTQEGFLVDPTLPQSAIALGAVSPNPVAHDFPNLSGMAASMQDSVTFVFRAWRVIINSGTGSIRVTGRQAGLASP